MAILGQSETLGRNSKSMLRHEKLETDRQIFIMTPHQNQITIEHHTTMKDIIHDNQPLHSLTTKDKEDAFIIIRINGMMNVRNFQTFRVENNKYMDYVTIASKKDIC